MLLSLQKGPVIQTWHLRAKRRKINFLHCHIDWPKSKVHQLCELLTISTTQYFIKLAAATQQANSALWMSRWTGRITTGNSHRVLHCTKPSPELDSIMKHQGQYISHVPAIKLNVGGQWTECKKGLHICNEGHPWQFWIRKQWPCGVHALSICCSFTSWAREM